MGRQDADIINRAEMIEKVFKKVVRKQSMKQVAVQNDFKKKT